LKKYKFGISERTVKSNNDFVYLVALPHEMLRKIRENSTEKN